MLKEALFIFFRVTCGHFPSLWFISVTVSQSVHIPKINCLCITAGFSGIRGNGKSKIWMPVGLCSECQCDINKTCPECQLRSQKPLARKGEYCLAVGAAAGLERKIQAGINILKGGGVFLA